MTIKDRIKGALYGVAVGDAMGGPLEFMDAEAIARQHGTVTEMIGGGWLNLKPGEVTDDTQMTIAVIKGILANPKEPIAAIGQEFIKWYRSGPKDIGNTCAIAIREASKIKDPTKEDWMYAGNATATFQGGRNAGNGALMRTIYPALFYKTSVGARIQAIKIGKMTHWNKESQDAVEFYVETVHNIIHEEGDPWKDITDKWNELHEEKPDRSPTGYVKDTLAYTLAAILASNTFEDVIVGAVNMGGDADTIGAIAGGLAGAWYGYENIPQRWIDALDEDTKKYLDYAAEEAIANQERR